MQAVRGDEVECAFVVCGRKNPDWIDGKERGVKNALEVFAKLRKGQCSLEGSDQPERPVTALNFRSNPLIN